MKKLLYLLIAAAVVLAVLNPSEADYREHVREKQGVAGSAAMAVMDLLSLDKKVASAGRISSWRAVSTSAVMAYCRVKTSRGASRAFSSSPNNISISSS